MAMFSPINQIPAAGKENISECRMTGIAWTAQHDKLAADFAREHHAVAIVRKKCVFHLVKLFEIKCICYTDRRPVIPVAPRDIIAVVNEADTRVITVFKMFKSFRGVSEPDSVVVNLPVDAIGTESGIQPHLTCLVVTAKHSGKTVSKRNNGTVENTVGRRNHIPTDYRITGIAP